MRVVVFGFRPIEIRLTHVCNELPQALSGLSSRRFVFGCSFERVEKSADRVGLVLESGKQLLQGHHDLLIVLDWMTGSWVDGPKVHEQIDSLPI
jgi:hypothetical protein